MAAVSRNCSLACQVTAVESHGSGTVAIGVALLQKQDWRRDGDVRKVTVWKVPSELPLT